MIHTLSNLPSSTLKAMAISLHQGLLAKSITAHGVRQVVDASLAAKVMDGLQEFSASGWSSSQLATLADAVAAAREQTIDPEMMLDLVLSGPEIAGIHTRDTSAVMHSLIEKSQIEVILVGYAVHNGRKLFDSLAKRMQQVANLRVWLCLNIPRKFNDTSLSSEIVRRFAMEFVTKHWPWKQQPELYYDPRALSDDSTHRASFHAKCLIVDQSEALITSANITEAAQERNVEVGVIIRHSPLAKRLASYFEALRASNRLQRCVLPQRPESDDVVQLH